MDIFERPIYMNRIISRINKGMMLVLIGQRRVGKSFMLRLLKKWIEENRPKANVAYINKELRDFGTIKTCEDLYTFADQKLAKDQENYLLIDEVQDIEGYEEALRSLYAEQRCQIVITGSNAYVFSSELSTKLSGRYMEIPIYSLSYDEFLLFHHQKDSEDALRQYLTVGGLPGLSNCNISDEAEVRDYLQGVYNTVLVRDIILRQNIRNITFLENLSHFIADNVGKLISSNGISKFMRSKGEKISDGLISDYLRYICGALLANEVSRYDIHGKKLFELIHKYYFSDIGIRNLLVGFNLIGSIEKVIENVVYNHLRVWGWNVNVGILRAGEIDFVATKDGNKIYIQVAYLLGSEGTILREFGNLNSIKDHHPKMVVSMDPVGGELPEYPGIKHYPLRDFLKMKL